MLCFCLIFFFFFFFFNRFLARKVLEIIPQALTDQVSRFLEIVVVRFRRLLRFKPVEDVVHHHHNSLEVQNATSSDAIASDAIACLYWCRYHCRPSAD